MTPQRAGTAVGWKSTPPEKTPRLRLKPKAPTTGYVDGAWWPHSADLPTELPVCWRCCRYGSAGLMR